MPHSAEDKKRALTRLRRIRGQADALARAVEAGTDCAPLLQQIAALRGAVGGLMAEVLESHLRETFGPDAPDRRLATFDGELDAITTILRTYLK